MGAPGAVPPPIPPEVLDEEREKIRKQIEVERGKSRVLYEQAYQAYLRGVSHVPSGSEGEPAEAAVGQSDFYNQIRKAYSDAYSLRAFREIMEEATDHGAKPAPAVMPSSDNITTSLMRSGLPPTVVNSWLKGLDPEALGALIALSSNNPQLAMMAFAMNQRNTQQQQGLTIKDVIELNAALQKGSNAPDVSLNIPELIKAVKEQPPQASVTDIVNSTLETLKAGMALAGSGRSEREESQHGGLLENLLKTPEGIKAAKEIGLIGGDASVLAIVKEMRANDQQFQTQQKESDRRWDLRLAQLQGEQELRKAQIKESGRRTDLLAGGLQRIGGAIARAVAQSGPEGKTAEGKRAGAGVLSQTPCSECGASITIPPSIKPGDVVKCAKCGSQFEVGISGAETSSPSESEAQEEEAVEEQTAPQQEDTKTQPSKKAIKAVFLDRK
jgi:DNA-directed RNA polymerase subunit M/transcription elongation factor TFIIS